MGFKKFINSSLKEPINRNKSKTLEFYESVIGGVAGGLIISLTLFYIKGSEIKDVFLISFFIFLLFYTSGRFAIKLNLKNNKLSIKKHLRNYHINMVSSLIGATYISIILSFINHKFFPIISILAGIGLIVLFFILLKIWVLKPSKRK